MYKWKLNDIYDYQPFFKAEKNGKKGIFTYMYVSMCILNNSLNASEDYSTAPKIGHSEE